LEKGDYIFVDTKNKNLKRGFILFIRRKWFFSSKEVWPRFIE
jgi:hypothetical protein